MDLGPPLEDILDVKYTSGEDEKQRRKLKRKEKFIDHVSRAVKMMQVLLLSVCSTCK